ncbi:MAG: carbohydrate-binding family 9-like protein [Bacteroidales bacterium]|jgi:hypothetical protein
MKTLIVPYLIFSSLVPDMGEVSTALDKLGDGYAIDCMNWPGYVNQPRVRFNIGYSEKEIYIKYYVHEQYVMAKKHKSNESVCEDSCVEFFVSPDSDGIYYNFEFNPIGTCLLGKGTGRVDSKKVDPEFIAKVRRLGTLGTEPFNERTGDQSWELTVAIPVEAFAGKDIKSLTGKVFKANFYKCGDKLTQPHYLTWNPVGTPTPDYHQPRYFGTLKFEKR